MRGDHVHFIDGGGGGYASAASAVKAWWRVVVPHSTGKILLWFPMGGRRISVRSFYVLGKGTGVREICWLNKQRSLLWRQIHVLQRKLAATRFIRW